MAAIVVDGEPIVFGNSYGPHEFRCLVREVTGEHEEENKVGAQIQELLKQQRVAQHTDFDERLKMNLTEHRFQFVAEDCCAERPWDEKHDREYTVPVVRKSKWSGTYTGERRIRGCRCAKCTDDPAFFNTFKFMKEHVGVKFEI